MQPHPTQESRTFAGYRGMVRSHRTTGKPTTTGDLHSRVPCGSDGKRVLLGHARLGENFNSSHVVFEAHPSHAKGAALSWHRLHPRHGSQGRGALHDGPVTGTLSATSRGVS